MNHEHDLQPDELAAVPDAPAPPAEPGPDEVATPETAPTGRRELHLVPEPAPVDPLADVPLVLVTSRPEGMTQQAYRELQRQQEAKLKARKRGRLVHVSTEIVVVHENGQAVEDKDDKPTRLRRTRTYRKPPTV